MSDGRDSKGKFTHGNGGGPGRPKRVTEATYLRALAEAVTQDDWRAIVARAVADAKDGDHQARTWLANYLLGKPATDAPALRKVADNEEPSPSDILDSLERGNDPFEPIPVVQGDVRTLVMKTIERLGAD